MAYFNDGTRLIMGDKYDGRSVIGQIRQSTKCLTISENGQP